MKKYISLPYHNVINSFVFIIRILQAILFCGVLQLPGQFSFLLAVADHLRCLITDLCICLANKEFFPSNEMHILIKRTRRLRSACLLGLGGNSLLILGVFKYLFSRVFNL